TAFSAASQEGCKISSISATRATYGQQCRTDLRSRVLSRTREACPPDMERMARRKPPNPNHFKKNPLPGARERHNRFFVLQIRRPRRFFAMSLRAPTAVQVRARPGKIQRSNFWELGQLLQRALREWGQFLGGDLRGYRQFLRCDLRG